MYEDDFLESDYEDRNGATVDLDEEYEEDEFDYYEGDDEIYYNSDEDV